MSDVEFKAKRVLVTGGTRGIGEATVRRFRKGGATVLTTARSMPSTGPVEGHITRVKLIKRAGYGRAKLPLLRARILGPN